MARSRLLLLLAGACACGAEPPPGGPLDRPILGFSVADVLRANAAELPAGFAGPSPTVCAADTSRAFIAEILAHGISDVQVNYQWAPVSPGPIPGRPTVAQPELFVAGTVKQFHHSESDLDFSHPFGRDAVTLLEPDPDFASVVYRRSASDPTELQVEQEQGLLPEAAFGYTPAPGDRALLRSAWIFDCGHPPYETELHPPTFVAFARPEGSGATIGVAFASPYRASQIYRADPSAATAFDDAGRFTASQTYPFPGLLVAELGGAAAGVLQQLAIHNLLEALRWGSISFSACAPSPRPARAWLGYSYRFVARTGVTVQATSDEPSGCVRFVLTMSSAYQPLVPSRSDRAWAWSQISQEASQEAGTSLDIRAEIQAALSALGLSGTPAALADDRPPLIDQYAPLQPRPDAAADSPTSITSGADDQPFPLYGRFRVFWR